jgi:hypothetical protein
VDSNLLMQQDTAQNRSACGGKSSSTERCSAI